MAALLNGQHMSPHTKSENPLQIWQCPLGRPSNQDSQNLQVVQIIADTCTASPLKRRTIGDPGALHQMPPADAAEMPQAMNLVGPQRQPQRHHGLGLAMITEALANLRSPPKAAATLSEGN